MYLTEKEFETLNKTLCKIRNASLLQNPRKHQIANYVDKATQIMRKAVRRQKNTIPNL